ncbi:MAG: phosphotransferase [Pseudomonadota bacterium]
MNREKRLHAFVVASGHDPQLLSPLAGDASNRRYLRLAAERPLVVMDAPPERGEDIAPFAAVTAWLRQQGFSAPEILAADPGAGFLLLEDLGDALYARVCAKDPSSQAGLYTAATDLLAALAAHPAPRRMGARDLPPYDIDVLQREARLALEWYLPGTGGATPSPDMLAEFDALVAATCRAAAAERGTVVLRDYHAENLLWLPDRDGLAQVGLLDYQDALAGHPAYDLVSLLEDARRDTTAELREAMLARYLDRSGRDAGAFRAAYASLGAQRNLKIIGIFARLCLRDGKPRYPTLIPRVWAHLMRDLAHPDLAALRIFVMRHLPEPQPSVIAAMQARAAA